MATSKIKSYDKLLSLQTGSLLGSVLNHAQFLLDQAHDIVGSPTPPSGLVVECASISKLQEIWSYLSSQVHPDFLTTASQVIETLLQGLISMRYHSLSINFQPTSQANQNQGNAKPHFKIPAVKIPNFGGNHEEWQSFWGTFTALIDSDSTIPNVVKF